jgi:hypothetical protein
VNGPNQIFGQIYQIPNNYLYLGIWFGPVSKKPNNFKYQIPNNIWFEIFGLVMARKPKYLTNTK